MEELVNTAIQKYCILLARRHGIKDLSRVQAIVERTLINYDYEKFGHKVGLWNGSQTAKLLKSSLQILNYFPPNCMDFLKSTNPEHLRFFLKNKSNLIELLIKLFKFSPSLEEALNYLPSEYALDLFEKEDLTFLSKKEDFIKEINKGYLPFYTLDELVHVLEDFIFQLEQGSKFIIKTGYPTQTFIKHTFLDEFSRCYYIRCPERIEFYNPLFSDSYPECWIGFNKSEFWDLISEVPYLISPTKDVLLKYIWGEGSYEEAPLIEGLSSEEAKIIEEAEGRFLLFEYKLQILKTILQSLRNKDASDLWKSCLDIFLDYFKKVFAHFLDIEVLYMSIKEKELEVFVNIRNIGGYTYRRVESPYISGGLSQIDNVIGYFENEIKIGTFSKTKAILNKLPENVSLISYYQSVNQPWRKTLDLAFNKFLELREEEGEFAKEFYKRRSRDLQREFKVNLPIELEHVNQVKRFYSFIKSSKKQNLAFHIAVTPIFKTLGGLGIQPVKFFPTSPEANWYDVSICFIAKDDVEVRVGSTPLGVKNFIQMGFKDNRIHNNLKTKPILAWHVLRAFGQLQHEISWKDKDVDEKIRKSLKSCVKELRKKLKFLFGIEDDPFYSYKTKKAYKPKFNISVREENQD